MASLASEAKQSAATQELNLSSLVSQMQQLTAAVAQLAPANTYPEPARVVSPLPSPRQMTEPRIGPPERYAGEPEGCNPFLTNCSIYFSLQPLTFATEEAKVAFTVNQLTGRARLWGTAEWEKKTPACASFQSFSTELRKVFGQGALSTDAGGLLSLHQGRQSVADFAIDFRTKARQSCWNEGALRDAFLHGLADYIKDELVSHTLPGALDDVIALATNIDLRIQTRRRERQPTSVTQFPAPLPRSHASGQPRATTDPSPSSAEPMQVGRTSLTPEERERRRKENLSLYCGRPGHFLANCTLKGGARR